MSNLNAKTLAAVLAFAGSDQDGKALTALKPSLFEARGCVPRSFGYRQQPLARRPSSKPPAAGAPR